MDRKMSDSDTSDRPTMTPITSMAVDLSPGRRLSAIWNDFLRGSQECTPSERRISLARVREEVMQEFEDEDIGLVIANDRRMDHSMGSELQDAHLINAIAMLRWKGGLEEETDVGISEKVDLISSEISELEANRIDTPTFPTKQATSFLRTTASTLRSASTPINLPSVSAETPSPSSSPARPQLPLVTVTRPTIVPDAINPLSPHFISYKSSNTPVFGTGRTVHDRRPPPEKLSKTSPAQKKSTAKLVKAQAKLDTTPTASTKKMKELKGSKAPGYTPRPANAWILYRSEQIRVLKEDSTDSTVKRPQSDVCKSHRFMAGQIL
jgi:hypothetical protein